MRPIASALLLGAFGAVAAAESIAAPERPGDGLETGLVVDRPAAARRNESAAVAALLDSVDRELAAERPEQALALLERALRIEPRNAALWHYLGLANLALGNHAQAEAMAAKSHSLAGRNRTLRIRNAELTATALRAQGKPILPTSRDLPSFASRSGVATQLERAVTYAHPRGRHEPRNAAEQRRVSPSVERTPLTQRSVPRAQRRYPRRYGSNGYQL